MIYVSLPRRWQKDGMDGTDLSRHDGRGGIPPVTHHATGITRGPRSLPVPEPVALGRADLLVLTSVRRGVPPPAAAK